jgi:hypothetical protein
VATLTLADELRDVIALLEDGESGAAIRNLEAIAAKCEGKVLVTPFVHELSSECQAYIDDDIPCEIGEGETPAEAIANLQALLDGER